MECSIKEQKIQALKNYRRAKFVYNFLLYSLTSIITCFFFSYPFWFPSMNHFLSSLPNNFSNLLNAKCLFLVGNLIIFILVGESKLKQSSSSSSSDIYDEYVARSQSSNHKVNPKEICGEEKKKELRVCKSSLPHAEGKKRALRSCKSEVWGESEIYAKKKDKTKGKKEESTKMNHEEKKMGIRSCKSQIWGESEIVKKTKGQKEEEIYKSGMNVEEKKMVVRSCKSEIRGEGEIVEKNKGQKEEDIIINDVENKMGMRSCKSAVWGESDIIKTTKGQKGEEVINHEEKKMGMRSSKSAVWGESEIVKKTKGKEEEQPSMTRDDLNKRVEAFIARVNKQRLLESKLVSDNRG